MKRKILSALLVLILCISSCAGAFAASSTAPGSISSNPEWTLLEMMNEYRVANGKQPLSMLPGLQTASGTRADELNTKADKNRPNGSSWTTVLSDNKVSFVSATQCYMKGLTNPATAPTTIVNLLKNSTSDSVKPFRDAILNENFTHVGIGSTSSGYWLWILVGGCSVKGCTVSSQKNSLYSAGADIDSLAMVASATCSHGSASFPVSEKLCKVNADGTAALQYITSAGSSFPLPTKESEDANKPALSLNKTEISVQQGTTHTLKATLTGSTDKVTWTSSDEKIATVTNGIVKGIKVGTATVTATAGKLTATCKVTVTEVPPAPASITLSADALTLGLGQNYEAKCTITPANSKEEIIWSTYPANSKAVTVSDKGVITAGKQAGKAFVIASTSSGKSARIKVTVVAANKAVQSVKISALEAQVAPGASIRLMAKAYPQTATNRTITWKSSDPTVAAVNSSGIVLGVTKGTATIYAISSSGITRECVVTVRDVQVTSVRFSKPSGNMYAGQKGKLSPTVLPSNAAVKTLTWTSSDPKVATVSENGYVEAKAAGTVVITATSENGKSGSVTFTVKEITAKAVKLSKKSVTVTVGASGTIRAQISPAKASKNIIWTSSSPKIVSVDSNGKITAHASGSAVITATSATNSKAKASCTVRVQSNTFKRTSAFTANKPSAWVTGAYFKGDELRVQVCYYNSKVYPVKGTAFGDEVLLYSSSSVIRCALEIENDQLFTGLLNPRAPKYVVYTFSVKDYPELAGLNLRKLHANSHVG